MAFAVLLIFILVVLIIWWALLRNAKKYRPDFPMHEEEIHAAGHPEAAHAGEQAPSVPMETALPGDEASIQMAPPPTGESAIPEGAEVLTRAGTVAAVESQMESSQDAPGVIDDFTIIEGVGPRINDLLHGAGINSFAQLAATDVTRLREILESANLRFIDPVTWREQSELAAQGRMDDLKALTDRLKGGRERNN